jgi:Ser/Thr protein kinase RdoA (MazF antagonist)
VKSHGPERALAAYPGLEPTAIEPIASGLIHQSYAVRTARERYVLQRVRPIFDPGIHDNIRAVVGHLKQRGLATPELVATRQGAWLAECEGAQWRLWTWVPGASFEACSSPRQAESAARLIARFHSALADLEHRFRPLGITLHDPAHHLAALACALRELPAHRLARDVRALAESIFALAAELPPVGDAPLRCAHGDLKFSNIRFAGTADDERERAVALLDLDTVSPLPLWAELGDAWRSWCNRNPESEPQAALDTQLLEGALGAYLDACQLPLARAERASLALGLEWISLELASRFAADSLRESYFGWDPTSFPAAGEHNLCRARGQLSLYRQARETRALQQRLLLG